MNSKTSRLAALFISLITFLAVWTPTQAAITLNNTISRFTNANGVDGTGLVRTGTENDSNLNYSFSYNAGANADMIAVTLSVESSSQALPTLSYNGVDLLVAASSNTTTPGLASGAHIFYLANPFSGGAATFEVDFAGIGTMNGFAVSIASLNGNGEMVYLNEVNGSGVDNNTLTTSIDLTTSVADAFVLVGFDNNGDVGTSTVNLPLTSIFAEGDIGSNGAAAGYELSVAAGAQSYNWTVGNIANSNGARAIAAAAFSTVAIPEPSSLALFGFGGMLLLCRRRA